MHLQVPLIKPRKQWVRFSGMCLFIHFIISSHPPCSRVQKWHLFSQAHHTFFFFPPSCCFSFHRHASNLVSRINRVCVLEKKKRIFPPPLPPAIPPRWNVPLSLPSSAQTRGGRVGSPCEFEQINSRREITQPLRTCQGRFVSWLFICAVCEQLVVRMFI